MPYTCFTSIIRVEELDLKDPNGIQFQVEKALSTEYPIAFAAATSDFGQIKQCIEDAETAVDRVVDWTAVYPDKKTLFIYCQDESDALWVKLHLP